MKNKQVMALILAMALTAGSLLGCGMGKTSEDTTQGATAAEGEDSASESTETSTEEDKLLDTMQSMTGTSSMGKKQETVYVKASATGAADNITVSNWLQNTEGTSELEDSSDLNDIKNLKGKQNYTVNGIEVVWDAAGDDIYYQGTTDKSLPVDVNITYYLDDKEVSPDELAGATGHVKIKMDYVNKSAQQVDIAGNQETIYTPFAAISGMMLDSEKFRNVTVTNGTVVSDGNRNIVVGMAFPGFVDSLNGSKIEDDDILSKIEDKISIPSDVTIEADATDFELGMTLTMMSSDVISALGLEDVDTDLDLSEVTDKLDEFTDAGDELTEGTGKLRDGAQELSDGTEDLVPGTQDLYDGVVDYTDAVVEVDDGVVKLRDGSVDLDNGMTTLKDGIVKADAGAGSLADGAKQVSDGVSQVVTSMGQLGRAAQGAVSIKNGIDSLANATDTSVNPAKGSIESIASGVADAVAAQTSKDTIAAALGASSYDGADDTIKAYVDSIVANVVPAVAKSAAEAASKTTFDNINSNITPLKNGAETLATELGGATGEGSLASLQKLQSGAAQVASGAAELKTGLDSAVDGADKLKSGTCSLKDGLVTLYDGTQELKGHNQELVDGAGDLKDGAVDLTDGIGELLNGTIELDDGMNKFDEEGIQKLTDLFDTDYDSMEQRLRAIADAGKNYKSFSGTSDDEDSSVRFVIESAAIKK